MRIDHYQAGEALARPSGHAAGESFGRIARRRRIASSPTPAATRASTAAGASADSVARPLSHPLNVAARIDRARRVGDFAAAAWAFATRRVRQFIDGWQRRRDAHATWRALRGLDTRTLHDLGFHRSEILSVALDLGRHDETARLRTARADIQLQLP